MKILIFLNKRIVQYIKIYCIYKNFVFSEVSLKSILTSSVTTALMASPSAVKSATQNIHVPISSSKVSTNNTGKL